MRANLFRALFWVAFGLVSLFASCAASAIAVWTAVDVLMKKPVGPQVPGNFPLLAVTRDPEGKPTVHLLYHRYLEEFAAKHPRHSFRIAPEDEDWLARYLDSIDYSDTIWLAAFKVENKADGRQIVEFSYTEDDDDVNTGTYEVAGDKVRPTHHASYFGPAIAIGTLIPMGAMTLILFLALASQGRKLEKRLIPFSGEPQAPRDG